jgi:hypothetical protein
MLDHVMLDRTDLILEHFVSLVEPCLDPVQVLRDSLELLSDLVG